MKILISHPTGNQNSREATKAFEKTGNLKNFVTALNIHSAKVPWSWFPIKIKRELQRRDFLDASVNTISAAYIREFTRLIVSKINFNFLKFLIKHETGFASIYKVYQSVDKYTSKLVEEDNSIEFVYAYENGALKTFEVAKRNSVKCIYELPTGYWRALEIINKDQIQINPHWKSTLQGIMDSKEALIRKDRELELADLIIVASSFTKDSLESFPGTLPEIKVIPYGFPKPIKVDDRNWYSGKDSLKVLFVGGLKQSKGLSYMADAVKTLQDKIELTIIGTGPALKLLKEEIPKFNYLGSLPHNEVLKQMRDHDVLLFPSLFDGFGMVITEAMSQGMVVIATNHTGLPDISDEKSAICIPHSNSRVIEEALNSLVNDKDKVKAMGMAALERAKKYQWSDYRDEIAGLL